MKKDRILSLLGLCILLLGLTVTLLALNLIIKPVEPALSAGPGLSKAPSGALASADTTPEPLSQFQIGPSGSSDGICSNPLPIACGGHDSRDTSGYNTNINKYSCVDSWDEYGPEVIYSFTLNAGATYTVSAALSNMGMGYDLDVFLLAPAGCDSGTCLNTLSYDDTTATVGNVVPGTYYIAVDSYGNPGQPGSYDLDLTCTAVGAANESPYFPSNPSPPTGSTAVRLSPTLSWQGGDPDGDQVLYTVEGGVDGSGVTSYWCQDITANSCSVGPLLPNTTYSWWVHADDQHGKGASGGPWTFATGSANNPPNAPSDPSPADGSKKVDRQPMLSWKGGDPDIGDTVVYTVTGGLISGVVGETWCTGTTKTHCKPSILLEPGEYYYWQVLAADPKGEIKWTTWEFTTTREVHAYVPIVMKSIKASTNAGRPPAPPTETPTPTPTLPPTNTPPAPVNKSGIRFTNYTPYKIVSVLLNGAEQYPTKPLGILPNHYVEFELAPGTYNVNLYNGWWQDDGSRFTMYLWYGNVVVQPGQMTIEDITGPAINELLPYFEQSRYWYGEYWAGDPISINYASFCFYDNGTFRLYDNGVQIYTGNYVDLYRSPGLVTFRATKNEDGLSYDGVLNELDGAFTMGNGPAEWRLIKYVPDDSVVCDPPLPNP